MKKLSIFLISFLMVFFLNAESLISFENIPLGCDRNFVMKKMADIGYSVLKVDDYSMDFGSKEDALENYLTVKPDYFMFYFENNSLYQIFLLGGAELRSLKNYLETRFPDLYIIEDRKVGQYENEITYVDRYSHYQIRIRYNINNHEFNYQSLSLIFSKRW